MDDRDAPFARLLRELRRARGLTQRELAQRAGFSEIYVALLERGRRRPPAATVQTLADALALDSRERAALRAAAGADDAPPPDAEGTALVGRTAEQDVLRRHLAGETGKPLLLLAGEPGIGKTRLLDEAARLAGAQRLAVVRGGCQRLGGEEGYAPFPAALLDALRAYTPTEQRALLRGCAALAALLPELAHGPHAPLARPPAESAGGQGQERRLLFEAVVRFLDNVSGPRGTLLVLDDLHWAGEDALALLTHLARSAAGGTGLRLIGAYRETETGPALGLALADLAHARLLARHALGPLPPAEAAHLLDRLLAEGANVGAADGRAEALRRAGGVPFYLVSWAQELHTGAGSGAVPWDVAQSIGQRVAALPAEAQALLDVAAVIGRTVPVRLLAAASGLPIAAVRQGLDTLSRARLLEEESSPGTGFAYRFTHDVVREVVENTLGAAKRADLHGRVGAALKQLAIAEGSPPPVEMLAYHYARAGNADERAARYLEEAAEHARSQYAYAAAEEHYRAALRLLDALGRSRDAARLRLRLGEMLRLTGRHHDEALDLLEEAAAAYRTAGDGEGTGRTLAEIGYVHLARGALDAGIARLREGAVLLAPRGDAHDAGSYRGLALLHLALAQLYTRAGRASEHLLAVERAAELARQAGDGETQALAELSRGQALLAIGRHDEGLAALERGNRLARAAGGAGAPAETLIYAAVMLLIAAAYGRCIAYVDRLLADARADYDPSQRAFLLYIRGTAAFLWGRWPTAAADYAQAVALVRASGPSALAAYPVYGAGYLAMARGEGTAPALLEEAVCLAHEADDPYTLWSARAALAEADLLSGHSGAALERLDALRADPSPSGVGVAQGTLILTAWARLELGDPEGAAEAADEGIVRARAEGTPAGLVDTLWVRARAAMALDDRQTAETMLSGALSLARGIGYRRGEARVLWAQGELSLARGNADGRARLTEALSILQELGARPEAALVERLLKARE